MTRLFIAAFIVFALGFAALAVVLARPRWDVGKSDTNRHGAGLFPTFDDPERRNADGEPIKPYTGPGPHIVWTSRAENGTGFDPRLMGV